MEAVLGCEPKDDLESGYVTSTSLGIFRVAFIRLPSHGMVLDKGHEGNYDRPQHWLTSSQWHPALALLNREILASYRIVNAIRAWHLFYLFKIKYQPAV